MIEAKRIDLVFINNKEKEVTMIDVAVPVDLRVNDKEFEKIEKDQLFKTMKYVCYTHSNWYSRGSL